MVTEKPLIKPDSRYSIVKAAVVLGISRITLQRWVKQRIIRCSYSKANNRKIFTGAELLRCWEQNI